MSRLAAALAAARDTKHLELSRGALRTARSVFENQFGARSSIVIADTNTFRVAGQSVVEALNCDKFIFEACGLYAEHGFVEQLQAELPRHADAIPVAVGSGTINDLTKLASHRLRRPYMCVATAASMDGYTAYGASITKDGSKQTFDCAAPRAVVADVDVLEAAPRAMTASGYADLLAKVPAGADWILADALGVEPMHAFAWSTVQDKLRAALSLPVNVERLAEGLMMGGFAMQAMQSSRPASGAEHQFSHLWDMEHATDASHGFKVGIGTLAAARLYESLLNRPLENLDIDATLAAWKPWDAVEREIKALFDIDELRAKAIEETRAKWIDRDALRDQLTRLRDVWSALCLRLRAQLWSSREMSNMLAAVGAPAECEQIGISRDRLRRSYRQAYHIRRRFTVLDLAVRTNLLDECLDELFPR